ncbi:XRE family transcriptional regulator [Candidiatus Paracoxiella cheracis]|uniref:XRE family transcriptional regulator n=1 Tax=Candidiatus Paracoxiella cheracis TaxID=3405120 RepID=UPI003BF5E3C1
MPDRTEKSIQTLDPSHKEARAKRVKSLRQLTQLSRRAFAERYGIPAPTLQNWEDAKGNGLSEKGARNIVQLLKEAGIYCSVDWLMYGIGSGPQVSEKQYQVEESLPNDAWYKQDKTRIEEELSLFHQHFPNAIEFVVPDDSMEPRFIKGEWVAGVRHQATELSKAIGKACIVLTKDGQMILREVRKSDIPGRYTLACLNLKTTATKPFIYDVELVYAAPVIWSRRLITTIM